MRASANKPRTMTRSVATLRVGFLLSALLVVALLLAACSQEEAADQRVNDDSYFSTSEFSRTSIDLPEGIEVLSVERTRSGKLWLLGEYQEKAKEWQPILWELDEDNSWKKLADFDELLLLGENEGVCSWPVILESNKALCSVASYDGSPSEISFYLIDPELESGFRKLEIDTKEFLGMFKFSKRISGGLTFHIFYPLNDSQVLIEVINVRESAAYPTFETLLILDVDNDTITSLPKPKDYRRNIFQSAAEYDGTVYVLDYYDSSNPAVGLVWGKTVNIKTFDMSISAINDLDAEQHKELAEFNESHNEDVAGGTGYWGLYANHNPDMLIIELEEGVFEYSNGGIKKLLGSEEVSSLYTGRYFFESEDIFFLFREDWNPSLYKYEKLSSASGVSST